MKKAIKHTNRLTFDPCLGQMECHDFNFVCRGCTMMNRGELWRGFRASSNCYPDNSYLFFVEELNNAYDPNAIMVVCGGEFFGTVGYVGKEFTSQVKTILDQCAEYRIDMVNEEEVGEKEISLVITWLDKEQAAESAKRRAEERARRKELGLPVTKSLRYMRKNKGRFVEVPVRDYEIVATYQPSGATSLLLTLETGEQIRILSLYFAEMQKPSFVEDMEKSEDGD